MCRPKNATCRVQRTSRSRTDHRVGQDARQREPEDFALQAPGAWARRRHGGVREGFVEVTFAAPTWLASCCITRGCVLSIGDANSPQSQHADSVAGTRLTVGLDRQHPHGSVSPAASLVRVGLVGLVQPGARAAESKLQVDRKAPTERRGLLAFKEAKSPEWTRCRRHWSAMESS
jgi:hypothetical protein